MARSTENDPKFITQTRIFLRPIASGVPLGFFSFALGMFMLGMSGIGVIPVSEAMQTGLILVLFVLWSLSPRCLRF
jgi:succinate-acetate transporter protein